MSILHAFSNTEKREGPPLVLNQLNLVEEFERTTNILDWRISIPSGVVHDKRISGYGLFFSAYDFRCYGVELCSRTIYFPKHPRRVMYLS